MSLSYQRETEMVVDHMKDTAIPRFFLRSKVDGQRSRELGRTVHRDVEWVDIFTPGERDVHSRAVKDEDKKRWPRQYEAFRQGLEDTGEGLPLEHWPACPPSAVADFRVMHVRTVEELAKVTDGALDGLPIGSRKLRDLARSYLEPQGESAKLAQLIERVEQLERDNQALEAKLAEQPKKRGRPRKIDVPAD